GYTGTTQNFTSVGRPDPMREPSHPTRTCRFSWIVVGLLPVAVAARVAAAGQGKGTSSPAQPAAKTANPGPAQRPSGDSSNDPMISSPAGPVVARVNSQTVSFKTLAEECIARKGPEVLEAMISKLLIQQACKAKGIAVSAQEIDQEVTRHAAQLKISRDDYFK